MVINEKTFPATAKKPAINLKRKSKRGMMRTNRHRGSQRLAYKKAVEHDHGLTKAFYWNYSFSSFSQSIDRSWMEEEGDCVLLSCSVEGLKSQGHSR